MPEPVATGTPPSDTPPVATPGTPAAPATLELSKFVGPNGELLDGWKEGLLPEDVRHERVYDKSSDLRGQLKQLAIQDRMIGKKGVIIPDKNSTPSDIDAFYKALGRPDAPEGYKIEFPDEFKDFYDPTTITDFKQIAFNRGFDQEDVQTVMNLKMEMDKRDIEWMEQDEAREKAEAETALKQKWGTAYESRLHLANRVISENLPVGEQRNRLLEKIGNDVEIADFLANIGMKFIEHKVISEVEPSKGITTADAQAELKEIIATPDYANGRLKYTNPGAYNRLVKRAAELAEIIESAKQTTS